MHDNGRGYKCLRLARLRNPRKPREASRRIRCTWPETTPTRSRTRSAAVPT